MNYKIRRWTQKCKFTQYGHKFFFDCCVNTPSKRCASLQNKFFSQVILFLLNSSLTLTKIWMECCI